MSYIDFEGTISWPKLFEDERDMGDNMRDGQAKDKIVAQQGIYVANIYITDETKSAMIAAGIPDTGMTGQLFKRDGDNNLFYKVKRPHYNPNLDQEKGEPAVVIEVDGETVKFDRETMGNIGNGTKVKVRVHCWQGKIVELVAVKVLELVEYTPSEGGESNGLAGF